MRSAPIQGTHDGAPPSPQNESLARLVDEVPAAIWTTDADLRVLTMNATAGEIFRLAPHEMIGRTVPELLAEYGSVIQPLEAAYRRALAGQTEPFVWVYQKRRIQLRLAPRRDAAGTVIGVTGAAMDVGEPLTMDGGYRLLFESNPLAMWMFDAETSRFLEVNQAAIRQYGYTREEFLEMTIDALWQGLGDDRRHKYWRVADLGIVTAGIWKHRRKDGSTFDVEIFYTELNLGGGGAWLVLAPDVTQRIAAQNALADSKYLMRTLFESPAMGVVHWGSDGEILDANDTFLQILGHSRADLDDGRVLWRQIAPLPLTASEARSLSSGAARPLIQRQYLRSDGTSITVLVAATEWPDRGGGMAFVIDITQRIRLEAQLLHWQKMEAIGRIAGGLSHDCNNYLTVILGYAELLLRQPKISTKVRAGALEIQQAGERAAALMQQLLTFGRKQLLAPVALRLNDLVLDMDQMLSSMIGETIELYLEMDAGVDSIFADQGQIEQVIVNLIVNARDAMPDGGTITLRTANVELDADGIADWPGCEPGDYVLLSIQDTGAGMTEEVQARIFEPFFTTKERGCGTGLGLAIIVGIVRQGHGRIVVSSTVGRGSTFTVYLPRATHDAPPATDNSVPKPLTTGKGTVLVVEDDPGVRRVVEKALVGCGYQVRVAVDGVDALRHCENLTTPLRLVLTDVVMPQMDGRHLGDHLRERFPDTKVLYMTGFGDATVDCPIALPADAVVLRKPFSPSALATAVHRMLDDSEIS